MSGGFLNWPITSLFWQTNLKISEFLWNSLEYIANFKMEHFGKFHPGSQRATEICVYFKVAKKFIRKIFCNKISVSKFEKRKKYHFLAFLKKANHGNTVASKENCEKCSNFKFYNIFSWIQQQHSKYNIFVKKLQGIYQLIDLLSIRYQPFLD